jgi:hypothetical protein
MNDSSKQNKPGQQGSQDQGQSQRQGNQSQSGPGNPGGRSRADEMDPRSNRTTADEDMQNDDEDSGSSDQGERNR